MSAGAMTVGRWWVLAGWIMVAAGLAVVWTGWALVVAGAAIVVAGRGWNRRARVERTRERIARLIYG